MENNLPKQKLSRAEIQRRYYERNREKELQRAKKYYSKNLEIIKPKSKVRAEKYRQEHPEKASASTKRIRLRGINHLNSIIDKTPCAICGRLWNEVPEAKGRWVMEWDHIDRTKKRFAISQSKTRSIESINEELKNCRLLCVICHRNETVQNSHWVSPSNNPSGRRRD